MSREFYTLSEQETIEQGRALASRLKAGDVICLEGPLGAGKTHFVKGIAKGLGQQKDTIHSPTYTLIHEYPNLELPLYHFDCYRLDTVDQALEIGAEEYFYGEGVSVIEWPDRIRPLIPEHAIWVTIDIESPEKRKFVITE